MESSLETIYLTALETELADAFDKHCADLPLVTVHRGSILDLRVDAVISPANSFGFMDGGIDLRYSHHFGWEVQERLQSKIQAEHAGELLVGTAAVVPTDHPLQPWLIASPTMRVPMILPDDTVHPYLAARAVFLLIAQGTIQLHGDKVPTSEAIQSVAFPGLGTGVGNVDPEICARQICQAIEHHVLGEPPVFSTWLEAQSAHQQMYTEPVRDLQFPNH